MQFEKANLTAIEIVKPGKLGDPRIFNSIFTMQVRDADNIRLREETGGGVLYDIGIYRARVGVCLQKRSPGPTCFSVASDICPVGATVDCSHAECFGKSSELLSNLPNTRSDK